jgi:hypothetical protein
MMSEPSLNLVDVNARPRRCLRCGCLVPFVEPASQADKRELQELAFQGDPTLFMERMGELAHCDRRSAKAVFAHIVIRRGSCRHCRNPIRVVEYSDCSACNSFNIWWGECDATYLTCSPLPAR